MLGGLRELLLVGSLVRFVCSPVTKIEVIIPVRLDGFPEWLSGLSPLVLGSARINLIMYILWAVLVSCGVGLPLARELVLLVGFAVCSVSVGLDGVSLRPDLGGCSPC